MKDLKQALIFLAGMLDVKLIAEILFVYKTTPSRYFKTLLHFYCLLMLFDTCTKCAQICKHIHVKVLKRIIDYFQL